MSVIPLTPWLFHRPRRGNTVVDTVVLHAGPHASVEDLVQEFRDVDHSYHYIIDREGNIYKGVPFRAVAFHCGNSYGPHEATRGVPCERDAAGNFVEHPCVNEYSLSICLMNFNDGADPYPKPQLTALKTLLQDIKTPLPKLRFLTSHANVAPGRYCDPMGLNLESIAKDTGLEVWAPAFAVA